MQVLKPLSSPDLIQDWALGLSGGNFTPHLQPPVDIWQRPETFLSQCRVGSPGIWWVEARDAAPHPKMHRTDTRQPGVTGPGRQLRESERCWVTGANTGGDGSPAATTAGGCSQASCSSFLWPAKGVRRGLAASAGSSVRGGGSRADFLRAAGLGGPGHLPRAREARGNGHRAALRFPAVSLLAG